MFRTEKDYLGELQISDAQLYGINTARGVANLTVSFRTLKDAPQFRGAFAQCKWAAALANHELGLITVWQRDAITTACEEIVAGKHAESFVIDLMEGSGGTSTNMNFNEVIANRAQSLLGGQPGVYDLVHPNDHVNRSQSTNDVYPAAMKIAGYSLIGGLREALQRLHESCLRKAAEFADILHLGRTCMQDAQPMRLGQVFGGYAALLDRAALQLQAARANLLVLPLGGTAIGTGFGAPPGYRAAVFRHLARVTGMPFVAPQDSFDAMQNLDVYARLSAELRTCATGLGKIAADLILLSSGPAAGLGEIRLPSVQAGSSIMPGKVNPVVPMSLVQIGFAVIGNDVCVAQAVQAGQLEINHFEPVVADRVFESIELLTNGARLLRDNCIEGIEADRVTNSRHVTDSMAVATALLPQLGYAAISRYARQSVAQARPLIDILDEAGVLAKADALRLLDEAASARF